MASIPKETPREPKIRIVPEDPPNIFGPQDTRKIYIFIPLDKYSESSDTILGFYAEIWN